MRWKQGIARAINVPLSLVNTQIIQKPGLSIREGWRINEADYVRHAALYMLAHEIKQNEIQGDVAELGVYQGKTAAQVNRLFPEKRLYLFDTFEGFDERDMAVEKKNAFHDIHRSAPQFKDTSTDAVMKRMKYPDSCCIVKGFFPESLAQLAGADSIRFCFVSIDVDLYQPMLAGLCYFYEKLQGGGYILVHDYHNAEFSGVHAAVQKFIEESNATYVPIPDAFGSVVIMKPYDIERLAT
ncbi:MAG: TylF/MycF family methyltransferase [Lachnospiraceae bacterium]|jgi:O-methyltransferase|nr:TylF/MycF family methyltransferase [Lachnospiraceae bacterium]